MNTTKIYSDGDGYLLATENGNYEVRNSGYYHTTRTPDGLDEAYPDTTLQGVSDNANQSVNESKLVSVETGEALNSLIQLMVETAQ